MNAIVILACSLGGVSGLVGFYWLVIRFWHFCVKRFGCETTAFVISAQRYDKDGDAYLQGHYVYQDATGCDHVFDFVICNYWPGNEQWQRVMQFYTQGAQNRVRYLPWLPTLHKIEMPI